MDKSPIISLPIASVHQESMNPPTILPPTPPPPPSTVVSSASRIDKRLSQIQKREKVIEKIRKYEIEDDLLDAHEVLVSSSDSILNAMIKPIYDSWIGNLDSVDERRNRFMRTMCLSSKRLKEIKKKNTKNEGFIEISMK
ncbi:hypothetical protein L6452_05394 [Arctium lappa]|uniref:Uncharacterized protein n=1 Tax=Arctium lappa TaxID=4217 RepID=A0ACB9EGK6_ARCLA|nr:hypothetical protein L6452_05394 [Arctium lappa]